MKALKRLAATGWGTLRRAATALRPTRGLIASLAVAAFIPVPGAVAVALLMYLFPCRSRPGASRTVPAGSAGKPAEAPGPPPQRARPGDPGWDAMRPTRSAAPPSGSHRGLGSASSRPRPRAVGGWLLSITVLWLGAHPLPAPPAMAQDFQPLIYSREEIPFSAVENPPAGSPQEDLEVKVITEKVTANVPLVFNEERTIFFTSLGWERVQFRYSNLEPEFADNAVDDLYTNTFLLTYIQKWTPQFATIALISTNRSADSNPPPPGSRKTLGGLIFQYSPSEVTKYGLGAVLVDITGESQIFPAVQYSFDGELLKVKLDLPAKANAALALTEALRVGTFAQISGANYQVRNKRRAFDELKYSVWRYGWEVIVIGKPGLQVSYGMGQTVARRYEGFADGKKLGDLDLEDSPFHRITVGLVF